jgi:MFS family permease
MLSVVLVFYLTGLGLTESQTGLLLGMILAGDTAVSLALTTQADRIGRRRMLIAGAVLMAGAGLAFALSHRFLLLVIAGTIGVVSPSGNEVGPFLPIEQAALSEVVSREARTAVFAWYQLTGAFATALGSLFGGFVSGELVRQAGFAPVASQRAVVVAYGALGLALAMIFSFVSDSVEVKSPVTDQKRQWSMPQVPRVVWRLSGLFSLDAFGGGFVVQSFAAYWFYLRFGLKPEALGGIFFGANLLAGISALLASRLAARIGLVRTMVFTHLPSNILLIFVPLMPTAQLATAVLLLRFSISQMDVPTRQSYTMAVVTPEERSAAAGVTGVARTTGAAIAPLFAGMLFADPRLINYPFFIAGGLKIAYDLLLYRAFIGHRPVEEGVK